ncbi:MAG: thiol protease/hemagglutinin PrtT [Bacteroidaceae bacterium]|nr:thiol protease/hemagglutinin PrtT [Bacteroidaceae bacterium]MBR5457045.1 thiol protease/hemagglutinin PrtT [Bacteroidaceae bacterium]
MKRTFTFILVTLFLVSYAVAGPIDPAKALEIANTFWNSNVKSKKNAGLRLAPASDAAKAPSRDGVQKSDPAFYVFNSNDNKGFVIISGDDELKPVVGYSDNACLSEMPTALAEWLDEYSSYVNGVRNGLIEPAMSKAAAPTGKAIAPMLETSWNQSSPYNNKCPEVNGQKTPTGCTATAMAQIMKFHEWPITPKTNIVWNNNITGVSETLYLTSRKYDWSKMLPHYRNGYTAEQADAVATLMEDVGKAIQSNYALAGTGSSDIYASYALVNVFDYSPDVTIVRRSDYTDEEYFSIIRENLNARQPLLYSGHSQSYNSGHAFVCDGIDENNLLHIDWGWDGAYNGYFDMTYMSPEGIGIGGGDGRYNVGQSMVANIRPRTAGEPDKEGVPTVYMMDVVDVNVQSNPPTIYEQAVSYDKNKNADVRIVAGLLNWSHSSTRLSMAIGIEKDGELVSASKIGDPQMIDFNRSFGYYIRLTISSSPTSQEYLEEGLYRVILCYTDDEENIYIARGAENGLILEVNESYVTIRKELPEIEASNISFHATPQMKGDRVAFDAKFKTTNGKSATVLLVPVINQLQANGTYKAIILNTESELIQVHDDKDMVATFETNYTIPEDGEYYLSFKYNLKNQFIDREQVVDKSNLFDIAGKGDNFIIKSQFDGPTPSTTSITATSVTWGNNLSVSANVKNIASTAEAYSGTLAIFAENIQTGKKHILMRTDVEKLAKNATTTISYNQPDCYPSLEPGNYTAYVCERKGGAWQKIRQSAATCNFSISAGNAPLLYADGRIEINNGMKVKQGEKFDTKVSLACTNGDFNGYVKIQITSGLSKYVEGDYVAVSLKNGDVAEFTIPANCKTTTPLGQYRININLYDSNKNKIGTISNNTITYPDNGYFWVADVTAIYDVTENSFGVNTDGNTIIIEGADSNTVIVIYSVDGKEVYRGIDKSVAVKRGMYIVSVETEGEKPYTTKIFVK